jgi:hypothetical protein
MADQTEALLQKMQDQIDALQINLAASAATTLATKKTAAAVNTALAGLPPTGMPNLGTTAPIFALSPAMANSGAFLDLATSTGARLFKLGSEPLSKSFDFVDPSDLQVFLDLLKTKSKVQGWSRIFTGPVEADGVTTHHSLLHNYGVIPLESVALDAVTCVKAQSMVAQDSFMLFQCIFASLNTEFLKVVTTEAPLYHIIDTRDPQEPPIPCGIFLLKIIIRKAHVDTRATVSFIRTALASLDTKTMALDSDISKFNLEARGETTTDLLVNVFKGYETAQDSEFALFIKRKKDSCDEGGDITVTSLMDAAENKLKTRVLLQTWSAPTKEQERILALTVQVHQLCIAKVAPEKDKSTPNDSSKAKQDKEQKWAWKKVLPKEREPVTKLVDGENYHLVCEHHPNQWVCHTTTECSKNPANMAFPRMLRPNSASRKPVWLQLVFWLKMMRRRRNLMRILTAAETVAREDFIPCSYIFSVGHPSHPCFFSSPSSFLYGPGNLLLPSPISKVCYGSSLLLCLTPCPIPMFPSASSLLILSGSNLGSSS